MRYFQSLGQVKSANSSPATSPTRTTNHTSTATIGISPTSKQLSTNKSSDVSEGSTLATTKTAADSANHTITTSPPPFSSTLINAAIAASPISSVRPRPIFSRSEADGDQKRWLLRPLPPNARKEETSPRPVLTDEALLQELGPLLDETIHAPSPPPPPPSAAPSTPSSPIPSTPIPSSNSSVSLQFPPAPKRSWWKSLFSSRSSEQKEADKARKAAEKEASKQDKKKQQQQRTLAESKYSATKGTARRSSASSASSSTPISPAPSSANLSDLSSTLASTAAVAPPPVVTRQLSEWATLQQLYDDLADHAAAQQSAWETLESVLDKRERAAADERKQAAANEKARREREALLQAQTTVHKVPHSTHTHRRQPSAHNAGVPIPAPIESHLPSSPQTLHGGKASSPLVPSSHALSSSSSAVLWNSNNATTTATAPLTPIVAASTSPPTADRPARKSILSVLQSVPAPTLMTTEVDDTHTIDGAGIGFGILTDSSSLALSSSPMSIPSSSLRPLAVALRTAVLEHLSRSLPSTPPAYSYMQSFGATSSMVKDGSGAPQHARRASDSQASASSHPRSAPPSIRSNSFSLPANEFDIMRFADREEQRYRHFMQHQSPPSPSSLVF